MIREFSVNIKAQSFRFSPKMDYSGYKYFHVFLKSLRTIIFFETKPVSSMLDARNSEYHTSA